MILMSLWVSSNIFPGGFNVEQHRLGMVIKLFHNYFSLKCFISSVVDPDPGSGAFLTLGSGIRNRFFPDLGSRIPNP
jgi:hypothetical protein